ncbi:MAG: hypothetical protein RJA22_2026 [Verrucomicrobiota bacterium]
MNPAASSPAPRQSLLRGVLKGAALLFLVLLAAHALNVFRHHRAIDRLEDAVRAKGEPLTLVELAAAYGPIPETNNAAALLLALWKERDPDYWQAFLDGKAELPAQRPTGLDPKVPFLGNKSQPLPPGGQLSPESLATAQAHLRAQAGHLQGLQAALTRPQARFPVRLTNGYTALLPHLAALKGEAQLLRLESAVAVEQADPDRAVRALAGVARVGNLLAEEPTLISQLVRLACGSITMAGTEHLLTRQTLSAPQLDALAAIADSLQTTGALRQSLLGERAFAVSVGGLTSAQFSTAMDASGGGLSMARSLGLLAGDQRLLLETLTASINLADQPLPVLLRAYADLQDKALTQARRFPPRILTSLLLPALEKIPEKLASHEARRRALLTAIAIERHRLAHNGQLPGRLEDLAPRFLPTVPQDPFAEGPLLYRTLKTGYVVYAVGVDLQDDGGRERDNKAKGPFDVPFTVKR